MSDTSPTFGDFLRRLHNLLTEAVDHYEASAPTVSAYCDDLYRRLNTDPINVRFVEIMRAVELQAGSHWMQPNHAANWIYKLESLLGRDTTGHAGF